MMAEGGPDTPADEAGLRSGDVILSLEGEPVASLGALSAAVAALDPGDAVRLEVWRSEEVVAPTATPAALPADPASAARPASAEGEPLPEAGLTLHDVMPGLREARGLLEDLDDGAVLGVGEEGPDGLREGCVSCRSTARR